MMTRPIFKGFILIELLFSLVISSFLLLSFNSILYQSERAKLFVEKKTTQWLLLTAMVNQIERDFIGIMKIAPPEEEPKKTPENSKTPPNQKPVVQKETPKKEETPITIIRNAEGVVEKIEFATVNPLPKFIPGGRMKMVTYSCSKNPDEKNKFLLKRSERPVVDKPEREKQNIEEFLLSNSISYCAIKFIQKTSADQKEAKEPVISIVDTWPQLDEKTGKRTAIVTHLIFEFADSTVTEKPIQIITPLFAQVPTAPEQKPVDQNGEKQEMKKEDASMQKPPIPSTATSGR